MFLTSLESSKNFFFFVYTLKPINVQGFVILLTQYTKYKYIRLMTQRHVSRPQGKTIALTYRPSVTVVIRRV